MQAGRIAQQGKMPDTNLKAHSIDRPDKAQHVRL